MRRDHHNAPPLTESLIQMFQTLNTDALQHLLRPMAETDQFNDRQADVFETSRDDA